MINFFLNNWWEFLITIISFIPVIILFTIKGKITHWFNKDLENHRSELDEKSKKIQKSLDTQLEIMRIEFSLIQTERLNILKEACERITEISNQINVISSFHNYDCKENVSYDNKCKSEEATCSDSCIINYWNKVVEFDRYTRQTNSFFDKNQMFFPLEVVSKHLEIIVLIFNLRGEAYEINQNKDKTLNEKALDTFKLFNDFDSNEIHSLQRDLVNEYRLLIGVSPLKSFPISEYRYLKSFSSKN